MHLRPHVVCIRQVKINIKNNLVLYSVSFRAHVESNIIAIVIQWIRLQASALWANIPFIHTYEHICPTENEQIFDILIII